MTKASEQFQRILDRFNEVFAVIATREGFVFDPKSGPGISRSMRMECGPLKRGVFLEMKDPWMESDPIDPQVTLTYGVWVHPAVT